MVREDHDLMGPGTPLLAPTSPSPSFTKEGMLLHTPRYQGWNQIRRSHNPDTKIRRLFPELTTPVPPSEDGPHGPADCLLRSGNG